MSGSDRPVSERLCKERTERHERDIGEIKHNLRDIHNKLDNHLTHIVADVSTMKTMLSAKETKKSNGDKPHGEGWFIPKAIIQIVFALILIILILLSLISKISPDTPLNILGGL